MPSFDRDAALKTAEKALRQGRIDGAIAEYLRIVEAQPRDWNSANTLGDLYVRANQIDKGIAQYAGIAERLALDGFYPKAAALYKKILKIRPGDETAALQAAEIAAKQGLLADAKNYLTGVVESRRRRNDRRGAAEIEIRLGTLDPNDLEARLGAARAAAGIDDIPFAAAEFQAVAFELDDRGRSADALDALREAHTLIPGHREIRGRLLAGYLALGEFQAARSVAEEPAELKRLAAALQDAGRGDEALDVLVEVAARDAADLEVRADLARTFVARGDLGRARQYLDADTAGSNATLWLILAEMELLEDRVPHGRGALERALALDGASREAVVALGCRLAERVPDAGYQCVDAAAEHALWDHDFEGAAAALRAFAACAPHHLIALMRLVEICVDGDLELALYEAQALLADAYLHAGRALEARIVSEDLLAREPGEAANQERFRRALEMLGEPDPDALLAARLSDDSPFLMPPDLDLNDGELVEPIAASPEPRTLRQVFHALREEADVGSEEEAAAEQYALGVTYQDLGMLDDAIAALESAARSPRQRFDAASRLGRLHLERQDAGTAVEWFERAAEAAAPTPDAGRALLYDLATALEQVGEHARALAVYVELEAESHGFRDASACIARLSRAQAQG